MQGAPQDQTRGDDQAEEEAKAELTFGHRHGKALQDRHTDQDSDDQDEVPIRSGMVAKARGYRCRPIDRRPAARACRSCDA